MAAAQSIRRQGQIKNHYIIFGAVAVVCFVLFAHDDLVETANHAYMLLQNIASGRLRSFYGDVEAHQNNLYYLNNAHYNIAFYAVFALAELPVFLWNQIFGTPVNEAVLTFICKGISGAAFVGCMVLMEKLTRALGLDETSCRWAPLFFALWPPAFFSVWVMGQYDVLGLLLILAGLLFWMKGRLLWFALVFGAAFAMKNFAVLPFIPLLLLKEKRPLHLMKYGAVSLWLLVPTGLLFRGVTFSAGAFNDEMMQRLFAAKLPAAREMPIFAVLYGLLCIVALFWRPKEAEVNKNGIYLCLVAFGLVFLFVLWHPQWMILLAPFVVLTTLMQKDRRPWVYVDIALCAGFFLVCAAAFSRQLEAGLFNYGMLGWARVLWPAGFTSSVPLIERYMSISQIVGNFSGVLLPGCLLAHLGLKLPLPGGTPAQQLARQAAGEKEILEQSAPLQMWLVFGVGFGLFWVLPVVVNTILCALGR